MKFPSIAVLAGSLLGLALMEAITPALSLPTLSLPTLSLHALGTASAAEAGANGGGAGNVTQARALSAARDSNWLVNGGNFESQHYSPLKSINDRDIGRLGLAWAIPVDSHMGLETEPIVVDGVIYLALPFDVIEAIDGTTGKLRWRFDPHIRINGAWRNSFEGRISRGLAVWHGKVYVGTGDCRVVAVDAASGTKVWDTPVCDADQTGITDAPRVGDGKVYMGWSGMEYDVRGGVVALDAETGQKAWTFWTAPGDPSKPYESKTTQVIAKTWKGQSWQLAGANVWTAITYDPVTNLLLMATSTAGEAAGDFSNIKPSGNLLFANCIIAVNASTGQYVWHYQTAYPPNGAEDFHILLANLDVGGKQRRVVMTVPRNGVFYTLDARTGKEVLPPRGIGGTPYPSLKQIDLRTLASESYQDAGSPELPATGYGHGWFPMGYNPQTGLVYISGYEELRGARGRSGSGGRLGGGEGAGLGASARGGSGQYADYAPVPHGKLIGFDPIQQRPRWIVTLPVEINGGVLTTAGNLVFHGDASGVFAAYAADTGRELWSVKTGSAIQGVPVTYVVNGEEYVLIPIGMGGGYRLFGEASDTSTLESKRGPARLLAFKLGGKAAMPPIHTDIPPVPQPPEQPGTVQQIAEGKRLYDAFYCQKCHSPEADGSGAWVLDGEVPDLRYMPRDVHAQFMAVVLGGTHHEQGMPSFSVPPGWPWIKTALTAEQAEAIHDYIIDLEWRAYKLGPRGVRSGDAQQ